MAKIQYGNNWALTPAECDTGYWLYWNKPHTRAEILAMRTENRGDVGKWMLFYDLDKINNRWAEAIEHFDNENLRGVDSIKVSTNKPNPRASNQNTKVIIFYCRKSDDEAEILATGRRIIYYMQYDEQPFLYYKTDEQTQAGTGATGSKKNHLYKLSTAIDRDEYEANET
jgi:hypothetical protein